MMNVGVCLGRDRRKRVFKCVHGLFSSYYHFRPSYCAVDHLLKFKKKSVDDSYYYNYHCGYFFEKVLFAVFSS